MESSDHARRLGVVISELEHAVMTVGDAFAESQIGEALREHHPGRRGSLGKDDPLVPYELNGGPVVLRTLRALEMLRLGGEELPAVHVREHVMWVQGLLRAIQRLTQMCWAPIPVATRTAILDDDDAGPAVSSYITDSRTDQLGPALNFEDLRNRSTLGPWRELVNCARATSAYAYARERAVSLGTEPLQSEAAAVRARVNAEVAELGPGCVRVGDYLEAKGQLVRHAYDNASPGLVRAAAAIRAYNALVNHVLFAVFGIAERLHPTPRFERGVGPLSATLAPRQERVSFAVAEKNAPWISPPDPFVIDAGIPVDGVYLSDSGMLQFAFESVVDIAGVRLAAFESMPQA